MNFIKNTYGRTTHKGLQMVGKREAGTVDIGFNQEIEKFNHQHKLMKKFIVDLREYLKAFRVISTTHAGMNQTMEYFYEKDSPMFSTWKRAHDAALVLDQYRQKMDENVDIEIIAPLNARLATYKVIKKRIAERNVRLLDHDRARAEYKNMGQNPATRPDKLQEAQNRVAITKHSYDCLEEELMRDLHLLHQDRLNFFDPLLTVIIRMQAGYYTEGAKLTSELAGLVRNIDSRPPSAAPITPNDKTTANPKNIPPFTGGEAYPAAPISPRGSPSGGGGGAYPPSGGAGYPPQQAAGYSPQPPHHGGYPPQPQHGGGGGGGYPPQHGGSGYAQPGYAQPQQAYGGGGPAPQQRAVPAIPPMPARPPTSQPQARGLYPFAAGGPSELSFNPGDILTIHKQEGDWWLAELHGRQGLIPHNYVQML